MTGILSREKRFSVLSSPDSVTFRSKLRPSERWLDEDENVFSTSGIRRKALVAAEPFHPRAPSNCKGETGNSVAGSGLEAETNEIGVEAGNAIPVPVSSDEIS